MIIGICGKSGSGKSTLAEEIIKELNKQVLHLDIDKIGHEVLLFPEVKRELINSFGIEILKDNNVDRKKIAERVFDSRKEMDKLSSITWKYIEQEIDKYLIINKDKIVILDWILLPIVKYFNICDIKILLDIPYEIRKERAMKRDNIRKTDFDLREKASINFNPNDFDYVLKNNDKKNITRMVKKI